MTDAEKTQAILDGLIERSKSVISATEPALGSLRRRIDFWTLCPQEGKGYLSVAYEIKVSRSDFKRDTAFKQREARLYADRFYYVTPKGLLSKDEIPDWAGLMEWSGTRFTTPVHAPKLAKSAPSWDFVASIFRTARVVRRDQSIRELDLETRLAVAERRLAREEGK